MKRVTRACSRSCSSRPASVVRGAVPRSRRCRPTDADAAGARVLAARRDLERARRPSSCRNLEGFLADAAVASLAPARVVAHRPGPADAYVTFGAGTRAVGLPGVDGDQFDADEIVGDEPAGEVFERRTGRCTTGRRRSCRSGSRRSNGRTTRLPYDGELGAVADELASQRRRPRGDRERRRRRWTRARGPPPRSRARARRRRRRRRRRVTSPPTCSIADRRRTVRRPKLDPDRVVDAFGTRGARRTSAGRRARRSVRPRASAPVPSAYHRRGSSTRCAPTALDDADELFGRLLDRGRPRTRRGARRRADRRAPEAHGHRPAHARTRVPGYLKSRSSQRTGVVIAVDVGPTLLDQFGIDFTDKMEGRPVRGRAVERVARRSHRSVHRGSARDRPAAAERLAPMTCDPRRPARRASCSATVLVVAVGESVSARRRRALAWCWRCSRWRRCRARCSCSWSPAGSRASGRTCSRLPGSPPCIATAAWFLPRPYGPMLGMLAFMLGVVLLDAMTGSHCTTTRCSATRRPRTRACTASATTRSAWC